MSNIRGMLIGCRALVFGVVLAITGSCAELPDGPDADAQPTPWLAVPALHDFGQVRIPGDRTPVELVHTFELVNASGRRIVIDELVGSCGCLQAEASAKVVEPGAPLEIDVAMAIKTSGRKTERVRIITSDESAPIETITLTAVGVVDATILGFPRYLSLAPDEDRTMTLAAIYASPDVTPPAPMFETPEGVEATFAGWGRVTPALADTAGTAIRWQGEVTFRANRSLQPYECAEVHLEGLADYVVVVFLDRPAEDR